MTIYDTEVILKKKEKIYATPRKKLKKFRNTHDTQSDNMWTTVLGLGKWYGLTNVWNSWSVDKPPGSYTGAEHG